MELPPPFTRITRIKNPTPDCGYEVPEYHGHSGRDPRRGDNVLTLVKGPGSWLENSPGRVLSYDANTKTASIHLACDTIFSLRCMDFVIMLRDGEEEEEENVATTTTTTTTTE